MLRFQYASYLSALILVPILVLLFVAMLYWRRKKMAQFDSIELLKKQMLGYIPARLSLKFILLTSALVLLIIGCANLQKGGSTEMAQRKGVDVMIALDVSKSMLAKDVQPDRLTRAKQLIERLSDKMSNDRVGLIIFAGKSYLQVPLTIDYSALKLILQTVSPDMVPSQGTNIGDAIALANKSFSSRERKYKSIILISDGEDHDEAAISEVKKAVDEGVIIHTIGIGSPNGAALFDPNTNAQKLDEQGNPVISKLNEAELKNIATAGNGDYTLLGNTDAAATKIIDELDGMEQRNLGTVQYANYISYFQYFLLAALLFLIIEWLVPGASSKKKSTNSIVAKTLLLLCFIFGNINNANAQKSKKWIAEGNNQYEQKDFKNAAVQYEKALKADTLETATSAYNLGNALYRQKQPEAAQKAYELAAKKATNPKGVARANYNLGNSYMSEKKWEEAINAYKNTLRKNPQDADAKYNLAYAQQMLKKDGGGGKDKNKDKDKKDENKKEQEKKDGEKEKKDEQPKEEQGKQNQPQNEGDKKEDEPKEGDGKPQPQPSKLTEQQAEQLLNALQQEEKKLQEKKKKMHGAPVRMEKDW